MIYACVPTHMYHKGQARFLEGLQLTDLVKTIYFDDIKDLKLDQADSVIIAGVLPNQLQFVNHDKVYYCFNSPIGQADLSGPQWPSPEMHLLYQINEMKKQKKIIDCIAASKSIAFAYNFICLPHISYFQNKDIKFNEKRKNYGFLGNNLRKHKNAHNQLLAMRLLTPHEHIVVSDDFPSAFFETFHGDIKFLPVKLISDLDYFQEISTHRLGFQCSFSESFDYMTFEYCLSGVPSIVSSSIDWYPYKECIVKNPDDIKEIYDVSQKLLKNKCYYDKISNLLPFWAREFNSRSIDSAIEVINEKIK